jgi:dTDP-4-dehydrorhamnose reductase
VENLELWGGPECTVNRVRDVVRDQLELTGHAQRPDDMEMLAALNLAAVRYPVLWERAASRSGGDLDWSWTDARLGRLRSANIRVIAGLVHHGSGPLHTDLLDDAFAPGLGAYAAEVAQRYPWIEDWTPVNEPVTTARFAGLYGIWYPHGRDERSFWIALLNQIDGIRLAMRAVRSVNPAARLIQTDDLGRTFATAPLRDQAGFDNARRWAGWDLLYGRLTPDHALFGRIARLGLDDRLRQIADDPCPPDIIGINHYVTSDRFLDHRFRRYPLRVRGGNGRRCYADIEAVRVLDPAPPGIAGALREAWGRYRTPIAITEAHNGCTREEQMRWTGEAWDVAHTLRGDGIDIRAVTSWALFGTQGWNTLLTAPGNYESGAFDVRSGVARPTAIASLLRQLPSAAPRHPAAGGKGWWTRPLRLLHDTVLRPAGVREHSPAATRRTSARPLLICGATGTLGQAFARACRHRDIAHVLTDRAALSLDDPASVEAALALHRPWAVINATGYVLVDDAETHDEACWRANAYGMEVLAAACSAHGVHCSGFSSDLVFDGAAARPYLESDLPRPLGAYGRSKLGAERALATHGGLAIRTAAFFSPFDRYNFAVAVVRALSNDVSVAAADDHIISPTYVPHLVDAVLDMVIDGEQGVRHLAGDQPLSWAAFGRQIARACALDERLIEAVPGRALGWVAPRPRYAALGTTFGMRLAPLESAIAQFAESIAATARKSAGTRERASPPVEANKRLARVE